MNNTELSIKNFRLKLENYYSIVFSKLKIFGTDMVLESNEYYQALNILHNEVSLDEKIFEKELDEKNIKYLFKGVIGSGKTTLVKNICYRWAINEKYLNKYKLIVYLELKGNIDTEAKTIISLIKANYLDILNDFEINNILHEYQDEILFIFDGLDELETFKEKEIFYQINRFVKNSIIVSRTNSIDINKLLIYKTFDIQGFKDIDSLYKLTTDDFSKEENILKYFKKLFSNESDPFDTLLSIRADRTLREMLHNPLFLIIMKNNIHKLSRKYEFYESIIMDIILEYNKSLNKFLLIDGKQDKNEYIQLHDFTMDKLARIACCDDLRSLPINQINYLLSLGLLETNTYQTIQQYNEHKFIYTYFEEYLKAYYIVNQQNYSDLRLLAKLNLKPSYSYQN